MGLDISYYRNATLAPDAPVDEDGYPVDWDRYTRVTVGTDFPAQSEGLVDGIYDTADGDGFRAGSYSGYNNWREQLAKMAGYPAVEAEGPRHQHSAGAWRAESGPFHELIHFTDCGGVIGAKVSAKLAKDFADFQDRADALDDAYFSGLYAKWRAAFETSADNGFVDFH